jgi:hypothetical protein
LRAFLAGGLARVPHPLEKLLRVHLPGVN